MATPGARPSMEKALAEKNVFVPTGIANSIARPADLSAAAAPIWDVLLTDLTEMGVFKPADALLLVEICELLAETRRLRRAMDNPTPRWPYLEGARQAEALEALLELSPEDLKEAWPLSASYKRLRTAYFQALKALTSLIADFGITPVARLRLGLLSVQGATLAEMFGDSSDDNAPPTIDGSVL